jgi:two-component system cell cycle response regulator
MSTPLERLLAWERELLRAASLEQWLERLARLPEDATGEYEVALLVADPTHELRQLVAGVGATGDSVPPLSLVASLAGLAPHLPSLQGAWRGEYHAADHALLFPGRSALRNVLILPLHRGEHVVGLLNAATRDARPVLGGIEASLLAHAADVVIASLERQFDRARLLRGGLVDPLTGWNSQRYLQARLREEVARRERDGGFIACLAVDIDRLQAVNDARGHTAGDRALREIAARIESQVRASDSAARLASDTFVVLMPATDARQAAPLAERILAAVRSAPVDTGSGVAWDLRVSIGIAGCRPGPGMDRKALADQLLAEAMAALHRAKQAGGDRYEILAS